jgi:hypothetical protein
VTRVLLFIVMSSIVAGAALLGACFDKPTPACAFWCGAESACPDGYRCAADQWCKREDVPDSHECGPGPTQDAAPGPADAAPADAGDASPPDAALPDAALPDAAPVPAIDAALPDANGAGLR